MARKRTVHLHPPSICELEISMQGVKLVMSLDDEYDLSGEVRESVMKKREKTCMQSFSFFLSLPDMTMVLDYITNQQSAMINFDI